MRGFGQANPLIGTRGFGLGQSTTPLRRLRDPRMSYARELMRAGSSTAPVKHWTQGLARLLQGYLGGKMQGNVMKDRMEEAKLLSEFVGDPDSFFPGRGNQPINPEGFVIDLAPEQNGGVPDEYKLTKSLTTKALLSKSPISESPLAKHLDGAYKAPRPGANFSLPPMETELRTAELRNKRLNAPVPLGDLNSPDLQKRMDADGVMIDRAFEQGFKGPATPDEVIQSRNQRLGKYTQGLLRASGQSEFPNINLGDPQAAQASRGKLSKLLAAYPGLAGTAFKYGQGGNISGMDAFGKPAIKDFTPESIQKFLKTKNIADLKGVGKGLSPQILSAILPYTLGGVDFDDPNALIQALAKTEAIGRALSGQNGSPLANIPGLQLGEPRPAPPQGRSFFGEAYNKFGDYLSDAVDYATESASSLFSMLAKAVGLEDKTKRNKIVRELINKGFDVQLRRGQPMVNGQPLQQFMAGQGLNQGQGGQGTQPQVLNQSFTGQSQGDFPTATREEIREQTGQEPLKDDEGFWYIPNPNSANGKQFIRDKPGKDGRKVKAKGF